MSNGSDMKKEYCLGDLQNAIRSLTGLITSGGFCLHRQNLWRHFKNLRTRQ